MPLCVREGQEVIGGSHGKKEEKNYQKKEKENKEMKV